MGYDDSNNVCSKNLGIFNYLLYNVHKIDFEGRFLYKIRHAGPVWGPAWDFKGDAAGKRYFEKRLVHLNSYNAWWWQVVVLGSKFRASSYETL
jgi:hypothetical protein